MIRSAVCARMTLAFLLHADWSAAAWVCKAAGARSADLGINIRIFDVMITADRRAVAKSYLDDRGEQLSATFTVDGGLAAEGLFDSPIGRGPPTFQVTTNFVVGILRRTVPVIGSALSHAR